METKLMILLALIVVIAGALNFTGSITNDQFIQVVMFILGAIFGGAGTGYRIYKSLAKERW